MKQAVMIFCSLLLFVGTANSQKTDILFNGQDLSNSGVLLVISGEDKVWPHCVEAQLKHDNAGDLVLMHAGTKATNATPTKGHIGLQSEGTGIQFRNIELTQL